MEKTEKPKVEEVGESKDIEEKVIKGVSSIDAGKATQLATQYLEQLYGNLSMLLFRIENVRVNGASDRYIVLCSLLTNIGGPRAYYFVKVDITSGNILRVAKGLRNIETGAIDWKEENLPEGEE